MNTYRMFVASSESFFFFFNDTATTEIYTLSLHDALPISFPRAAQARSSRWQRWREAAPAHRSEEHTSELQSLAYLVCRLLLEKKKKAESCTMPRFSSMRPQNRRVVASLVLSSPSNSRLRF